MIVMRDFSCDFVIHSKEELACAVEEWGILPFFVNSVSGFSVEEHIDRRLWFTSAEGPWEWKGPLIREYGFAYGKFFESLFRFSEHASCAVRFFARCSQNRRQYFVY